jgi:xanthosine utilization system XapX-like protein
MRAVYTMVGDKSPLLALIGLLATSNAVDGVGRVNDVAPPSIAMLNTVIMSVGSALILLYQKKLDTDRRAKAMEEAETVKRDDTIASQFIRDLQERLRDITKSLASITKERDAIAHERDELIVVVSRFAPDTLAARALTQVPMHPAAIPEPEGDSETSDQ